MKVKKLLVSLMVICLIGILGTASAHDNWREAGVCGTPPYPPLPPGTVDIKYDDGEFEDWGPMLQKKPDVFQALRVRFTPPPEALGGLVVEVRMGIHGYWSIPNGTLHINLKDVSGPQNVSTPTITIDGPHEESWIVEDVSYLNFYANGDFYVELIPENCDFMYCCDDDPPIDYRSENDTGSGWSPYPYDADFTLRPVVKTTAPPKSCIEGKVKDERTQDPIQWAFILGLQLPWTGTYFWDLTDSNGYYKIDCPAGLYLVLAIKTGYQTAWQVVNVPPGGCVTADFDLVKSE
jgi:hypothetical protein